MADRHHRVPSVSLIYHLFPNSVSGCLNAPFMTDCSRGRTSTPASSISVSNSDSTPGLGGMNQRAGCFSGWLIHGLTRLRSVLQLLA